MAKRREQHQDVALEVVCNIGRAVAANMDLDSLLELIYRETARVMDTGCFTVALYDPAEDALRYELLYDQGQREAPSVVRRNEGWGIAGRVFEERRPLLLKDLTAETIPEGAILEGQMPRSWLGVPLIVRDHAIGVVSVQSYQEDIFEPAEQRLLEAIASQAAVTIENLILRRDHERRIAELSALNEIGRAIITATQPQELMEAIYRETSRVMDTANFYIALYHPERELISFDYFVQDGNVAPSDSIHLSDGGLTVHVITTRKSLLIEENMSQTLDGMGIQALGRPAESYLGVPMLIGDRVVGVLAVQSPTQPRAYDQRHQELLVNIANLAAVAMENARLSQERERRITELSILNEMGRALSSAAGLDNLLNTMHQQVSRLFDTTNFYIATYEEDVGEWTLMLQIEHGERLSPSRHKVGVGMTSHIIRTHKPILFRSAAENAAFHEEHGIPVMGERACSWLGVPLITSEKLVGVMAIQSYEHEELYGDQDLALFSTIAAQAAAAIENARLFDQLEGRLADLSVLNEVSQAILVADTEEALLQVIHAQVGRVMETTNFYVALYDADREEINFSYFVEKGERSTPREHWPLSSGGLTAYIVQTRQSLFLPDNIDAQLVQLGIVGRGQSALSYLGVPMVAGEQTIGAIAVQSYEREGAYTSRHLALLTNIATQAALAVQRLRLRASEQRKSRQLAIIGDVSRKVTAILDLDELLRELVRSIQLGFGYSYVAVFRAEEEDKDMVLGALSGRWAGLVDWGYRQSTQEGLIGWTAREGKTLLCNDVLADPRYVRGYDTEELTRAELCVPISYANRIVGVLDIQSEEVNAFDAEDAAAMETLAGQLATAMRNAILFRERGEQLANLNGLNRVVQATAAALSMDELLKGLCDVVVELMNPDGFFVALADHESDDIIFPMLLDEGQFYNGQRTSRGKGFTSLILRTGQPVLIRNMTVEEANYPVERSIMGNQRTPSSWLGVPLHSGDKTIGVISVQSYRNHAFDEQDKQFLETAAGQIVINIEKARLFENTQRALAELRESSERQSRLLGMVQELSTPLVPIAEGLLALPLVGTVDSQRAQQIMDVLLDGVSRQRARVVILDITGVPVVDTSVANYLLQATQAVRLLGAECILVGITPEVAQTVVGLGVELRGLVTRSDLQGGVEYALRLLGQRIIKQEKKGFLPGKESTPAGSA